MEKFWYWLNQVHLEKKRHLCFTDIVQFESNRLADLGYRRQMSQICANQPVLLKLRMMEVVVTTGAIRRQSSSQIITTTNQHPTFNRPDALPVAQPTVSKHCLLSVELYPADDITKQL